jgi:DNA mismatch repair protein MutS2
VQYGIRIEPRDKTRPKRRAVGMNRHALSVLQFRETLQIIAGHAASDLGAAAVRNLTPSDSPGWIADELKRVDQMIGLVMRAEDWAVSALPDLRAALRTLAVEGSVWEGPTLRDAAQLLHASRLSRETVRRFAHSFPLLAHIAEQLVSRDDLESLLQRTVDDAGGVRDGASRELASLRREIKGARGRIVEQLERYMASLPDRFQVSDASVTVRDGRYVIPVRREGRVEVGGLVHDESATGHTLFVEPPIAIELMNRLRELELAEAREVQRVLRETTSQLRPHHPGLVESLDALIALDSLWARARYALAANAKRPEMLPASSREYIVVDGRHPLLLASDAAVVPFDLRLDPGERTLLISGPNTGGKTVLLKAVGLLSALAQSGIFPPVGAGTKLPAFTDIFADIGDEQSIEASLSTFSAHLKNLREIVDHAEAGALVLIDEIGSGTDPAEGAALAKSILLTLHERGTLTVATTHLGELKQLAVEHDGIINASLQFDAVALRPTYRMRKGVPGRSYGIAIARRLNFPASVLERAEAYVPTGERDLGHLLEEIETKERAVADALNDAERARREARDRGQEIEARETALNARERDADRRAKQQARALLLEARDEVEAAIRAVREAAEQSLDAAHLEEASRSARQRVERRIEALTAAERTETTTAAPPSDLRVGVRVRIAATGAEGRVVEIRDDRVFVETGGVRLQVPAGGLTVVAEKEVPRSRVRSPATAGYSMPDFEPSSEVDLRGLRADEVMPRLQPALDAAIQAALPSLRIIHGKGTGALREVVAQLLRSDPRIGSFRPGGIGEGGTGVTVVELR